MSAPVADRVGMWETSDPRGHLSAHLERQVTYLDFPNAHPRSNPPPPT